MAQIDGFKDSKHSQWVCELKKGIYGLKQAGRIWNGTCNTRLEKFGFTRLTSDTCAYVMRDGASIIILVLYVDDMAIVTNDRALYKRLLNELKSQFELTENQSGLDWLLGVRVTRTKESIALDQATFAQSVLNRFQMKEAAQKPSPMVAHERKPKNEDEAERLKQSCDGTWYRQAMGSLQYFASATRPDMSFALSIAAKHMQQPDNSHAEQLKHVFRYLVGSASCGIVYRSTPSAHQIYGVCDANWINKDVDYHSIGGYVFYLGGGPISWKCKPQSLVALSSMEAEYISLGEAVKEAIWLRGLMKELGFTQQPTVIYMDSKSAIAAAKNPVFHDRTKHIAVRHEFIKREIEQKNIALEYIESAKNTADIFTKPLEPTLFTTHRDELVQTIAH
jgi:hypothetical protein